MLEKFVHDNPPPWILIMPDGPEHRRIIANAPDKYNCKIGVRKPAGIYGVGAGNQGKKKSGKRTARSPDMKGFKTRCPGVRVCAP
jgi:hypothetical protein